MQGFIKLVLFTAILASAAYFGQALIFMPGLWSSSRIKIWEKPSPVPNHVEKFLVSSGADAELEAWYLPAAVGTERPHIALFLHSGKTTLRSTYPIMKWLSKFGFSVYGFDYEGFGTSSGWPTEENFERDAAATLQKIAEKEKVQSSDIVLIGESAGGAIAARVAQEAHTKFLFILNPYVGFAENLGGKMKEYFDHVLNFKFPTAKHLQSVSGACVVLIGNDNANPAAFTANLKAAAAEKNKVQSFFSSTTYRSTDLLQQFQTQIGQVFNNCAAQS